MAAALEGFSYALAKFNLQRNNGFWAYAQQCIRGRVLDFIKKWNRDGITGIDTRASRALFADPNLDAELDAEELAKKARISLKTAQKAIDSAELEAVHYDTTESNRYDDDTGRSKSFQDGEVAPEFRAKYSCFDKYSLSPQLRFHTRSEQTRPEEEYSFRLAREQRRDLNRLVSIAARCSQYPGYIASELWTRHKQSADIRDAKRSREWQQNDWLFLEHEPEEWAQWRTLEPQRRLLIRTKMAMQREARLKQLPAEKTHEEKKHVRPKRSQANGSAVAEIALLQSRASSIAGLSQRCMPASVSQ